jgi:hypothetical protein
MTNISTEFAVETLWLVLDEELKHAIKPSEVFDQIAAQLHRHPRFRSMSVTEIDLILADARHEFQHDVDELEWRLVQSFKTGIGFDGEDAAA